MREEYEAIDYVLITLVVINSFTLACTIIRSII